MTLATWPAIPYKPLLNELKRSNLRQPISSEVEDGPPIMRRATQTRIKRLQYAIPLTDDERDTFETFVETTLDAGVDHFLMDVPLVRTDVFVTRRCYFENGDWSDDFDGARWLVRFTLCVFTATIPSESVGGASGVGSAAAVGTTV